jgi:hypothetical protein
MMGISVIVLAGSACGVLDLINAAGLFKLNGGSREIAPICCEWRARRISIQRREETRSSGLLFHFSIAFTAAAVYYRTSRSLPFLLRRALTAGILYGVAIHLFMSFVVIPLSRIPKRKFSAGGFFANLPSTYL